MLRNLKIISVFPLRYENHALVQQRIVYGHMRSLAARSFRARGHKGEERGKQNMSAIGQVALTCCYSFKGNHRSPCSFQKCLDHP